MTGQADLLEFQWHFFDGFRNTCRDIFGGSSGSSVFVENSRAIFALINTTTVGGEFACALGVPCEVTDMGIEMRANTSYATPIFGVSNCFDSQGRFNLDASNCPLDDGHQLTLEGYPLSASQPIITDNTARNKPRNLEYNVVWRLHVLSLQNGNSVQRKLPRGRPLQRSNYNSNR